MPRYCLGGAMARLLGAKTVVGKLEHGQALAEKQTEIERLKAELDDAYAFVSILREGCEIALWRLEQYNYDAMEPTIKRLRSILNK